MPDLSVQLVFDLSGLLDVEPFLLDTGLRFVDLRLPAGVELLGLQFVVWEARLLPEAPNDEPATYSVAFDHDWANGLYFMLLDARNTGLAGDDALQGLARFADQIDASLTVCAAAERESVNVIKSKNLA